MSKHNKIDKKSVLVKVSSLPPSKTVRNWLMKHIPRGVKILYTLNNKVDK